MWRYTLAWPVSIVWLAGCGDVSPGTSDAGRADGAAMGCLRTAGSGSALLIDDFEDGNGEILVHDGRIGRWDIENDNSAGGTQQPPEGAVIPTAQGANGSARALQTFGDGFTDWGALIGVALNQPLDRAACLYDASLYTGVTFQARSRLSNIVRFNVPIAATLPVEDNGTCTGSCYDYHGISLTLSPSWSSYTVTWTQLAQDDFGTPAAFDPATVQWLHFEVDSSEMPFDFEIDDLGFTR